MKGKVQPGGDIAVGRAPCDEVDDLELGVGEAVPARFRPRLTGDAALDTERAQLTAYAARIGERLVAQIGVERAIELSHRLTTSVRVCEFSAGVLGSRGVKQWPRRRFKHVSGSPQCCGVTREDP